LVYGTEFCANKLSNLAHDIHFIERDIKEEKELMKKESAVAKEEEKVIAIEQEELNKLKSEFQKYKDLCDEFDQNPTEELCSQFLKDAKYDLELLPKDSRANRIYNNLVKICE
jgi:geranylgeranyl pyrophosphate synthase